MLKRMPPLIQSFTKLQIFSPPSPAKRSRQKRNPKYIITQNMITFLHNNYIAVYCKIKLPLSQKSLQKINQTQKELFLIPPKHTI